jgi:hypothetical protein
MRLVLASISCALVLVAGGVAAAATAPLPPAKDFALTFERGGGFAPAPTSLTVRPGGSAVATTTGTRTGERKVKFQLGPRRIRSLQRSLRRANLGSIQAGKGGCADCFVYSITYEGDSVELEEVDVPTRLEGAIDEIETVISNHTIPPNARLGGR